MPEPDLLLVTVHDGFGQTATFRHEHQLDADRGLVVEFAGDVELRAVFAGDVGLVGRRVRVPASTPVRLVFGHPRVAGFKGGPWAIVRREPETATLWRCSCGWETWTFVGDHIEPAACSRCMGLEGLGERSAGGTFPELGGDR